MGRTVEFLPDGHRILVTPQQVADTARVAAPGIPAQYFVGTAQHETNFTINEKDTEPSGFVSMGLYQISLEEMSDAGLSGVDPYSLDGVTRVFADVSLKRVAALVKAANLTEPYPNDLWAMLSVAHNQGLGAALKSIARHGLDWAGYQKRNLDAANDAVARMTASGDQDALRTAEENLVWWKNVFAYGNDCITGGTRWSEIEPLPR